MQPFTELKTLTALALGSMLDSDWTKNPDGSYTSQPSSVEAEAIKECLSARGYPVDVTEDVLNPSVTLSSETATSIVSMNNAGKVTLKRDLERAIQAQIQF